MPTRYPLVAAAALLGLAACADPEADAALAAQSALVGMPKSTLLACAGVPERQTRAGTQEYLTYQSGSFSYQAPPPPPGYGWGGYGWGVPGWGGPGWRRGLDYDPWDYYPPLPGTIRDERCLATFTLDRGVVERLVYRATSRASCAAIVQNCLAEVPQRPLSRPAP